MATIDHWMSWHDGVDLVALTDPNLSMPNIIVHVARVVHTPVGSAPAGLLFWQPDPKAAPAVMGFVCPDAAVGAYFGPRIFAGTPFENAPVLHGSIQITITPEAAAAKVAVAGFIFESRLTGLAKTELVTLPPSPMSPFTQQGLARVASQAELRVNGQAISLIIPPVGIGGAPAAVHSECGHYVR